jgi:hypothetical protein
MKGDLTAFQKAKLLQIFKIRMTQTRSTIFVLVFGILSFGIYLGFGASAG